MYFLTTLLSVSLQLPSDKESVPPPTDTPVLTDTLGISETVSVAIDATTTASEMPTLDLTGFLVITFVCVILATLFYFGLFSSIALSSVTSDVVESVSLKGFLHDGQDKTL